MWAHHLGVGRFYPSGTEPSADWIKDLAGVAVPCFADVAAQP